MVFLKMVPPVPCGDGAETTYWKFAICGMDNRACARAFFHVWDKATPFGDERKECRVQKTTKKETESEFKSMKDVRAHFADEFTGNLETCMALFWEEYKKMYTMVDTLKHPRVTIRFSVS